MSNVKYAIFNLQPQGGLTLAHDKLYDTDTEAREAVDKEILPQYDATNRAALHKDLKLHAIGESPNAEVVEKIIQHTEANPEENISLSSVNLVIFPVADLITLDFLVNKKTLDDIREGKDVQEPVELAANDDIPANEGEESQAETTAEADAPAEETEAEDK